MTTTYRVTDTGAYVDRKLATFGEAVELARRVAGDGCQLPATIRDGHGCRWTVWPRGDVEFRECPAVEAGRSLWCECGAAQ